MTSQEIIIRPYKAGDRAAVRKICCDTAFRGEPMEIFFDDRRILADVITSYYTDYEPESTFVADFNGRLVGYLIGCKDTAVKERIFKSKILPQVFFRFLAKGIIFKKKTRSFLFNAFKSFLKGEFNHPEVPGGYPADLHINIDKDFRRFGLGARLMDAFFEYLKKNNVKGVHLATFSDQGRNFFAKSGFILFWEAKTSQWRYLVDKDIMVSVFGKKLS